MAGAEHYRLAADPAIQKLGTMTSNRHKYFRWTPRTARLTIAYAVVVPLILGTIAYNTDGKFDIRAKRKGDLISEY
ncbi:NADH:ubiquinone oxidoreductase 6.6kD subunit [Annulohypoxylon maeteangense]|uniref:NADH:ubiquinone oxidoreductase 6.6kD subunit n=1 Tax=Annulohypoxylon maeteangense TaxID=1927788 RepID=UPI0020073BB6|nr:NADH:ubiquinone oxidoreductase 6.6kD subunit [Annulohypoxylon maeteangense]KAI0881935.1 NADH:ubiquinone oxidoreductase 6.6kD subunit [Annulohypoxylon maeteangense]